MTPDDSPHTAFTLNGQPHRLAACPAPLNSLLTDLGLTDQPRGVAIAINDHVVPKSTWPDTLIHPDDRVEIIRATQGG